MTNSFSKEWRIPLIVFALSVTIHTMVYIYMFKRKKKLKPFERMEFASNVVSTINALSAVLLAPVAILYHKLWEIPFVSDGRSVDVAVSSAMQVTAYALVDFVGDIFCWYYYKETADSFKPRTVFILHHIFLFSLLLSLTIPHP
eukprot:302732_1